MLHNDFPAFKFKHCFGLRPFRFLFKQSETATDSVETPPWLPLRVCVSQCQRGQSLLSVLQEWLESCAPGPTLAVIITT